MLRVGVVLASVLLAAIGFAQSITVFVNGEPVQFTGVPPQKIDGRVLVPLRGVMEKLGAYVSYQASTRTVVAQRGDVDIQLTLGQRRAMVNGREVMLDVPAMEYRGSTLVPLRFMGEALGADVRWDAVANSVRIVTDTGQEPDPVQPPATGGSGAIDIDSFEVNADRALRGGSTVEFTLRGTPRGTASVQIPGVVKDLALRETANGVYTGSYTIPTAAANPVTVSKATVVGRLRVGQNERLIQSGTTIQIDNQPPRITASTPEVNGRVNTLRPSVTAVFDDQSGTGVDSTTVRISMDGRDVTADATITDNLLVYKPVRDLNVGRHDVEIELRDTVGNLVTKTWSFTVVDRASVITNFRHNATSTIQAGDEITFTLTGEAGGTATLALGTLRTLNMVEGPAGTYTATYVVRRTDNLDGVIATAKLRTKAGETFSTDLTLGSRVTSNQPVGAPTITSHKEGGTVGRTAVFKGSADPNAIVKIKIDFAQRVLGAIPMSGTIAEIEVEADSKGIWTTREIDLDTGLGRDNITYTITVVSVQGEGRQSEPTKITLKRG